MKLRLSYLFFVGLLLLGCQTADKVDSMNEEQQEVDDTNHYENSDVSFDYPSEWPEPEVKMETTRVRSNYFAGLTDTSAYVQGKYGPMYSWGLSLKEDMSNAKVDGPAESDTAALVCQNDTPCADFSIYGYDYSDLDHISSQFETLSDADLRNFMVDLVSDEEISGHKVVMVANLSPGLYLDVYVSDGSKSVVIVIPFGYKKNAAGKYVVREEFKGYIDQIVNSLSF